MQGAQNIRSAGTFGLSLRAARLARGLPRLRRRVRRTPTTRTAPNLIQALGDWTLGGKASRKWRPGLHGGGDLRLLTFSGVGNQGLDCWALAASRRGCCGHRRLARGDLPERRGSFFRALRVFRLHANAGFVFDGSGRLVGDAASSTAAEEFALSAEPLPTASPLGVGARGRRCRGHAVPRVRAGGSARGAGRDSSMVQRRRGAISVARRCRRRWASACKRDRVSDFTPPAGVDFGPHPLGGPGRAGDAAVELHLRSVLQHRSLPARRDASGRDGARARGRPPARGGEGRAAEGRQGPGHGARRGDQEADARRDRRHGGSGPAAGRLATRRRADSSPTTCRRAWCRWCVDARRLQSPSSTT